MSTKIISKAAIVDDDIVQLMLYERVINRSGLVKEVLKFESAEVALQYLKNEENERIDVLFLDINMPRMDGFEFLEAATSSIGSDFIDCVVIMLTTSLDPLDRKRAEEFKVVKSFLSKPLTEEALQDVAEMIDPIN
ncbi:histidine kinase [Chromatiales bacterium (ex Bugula neritina AB1)]|nr:histidine kinase [Chromatiales bacterium (ex Bugula neritina AB1)]